jgi:hypothetical protein
MSLSLVMVIVALILSALAAFNVPSSRVGLFPLAFAFYMLALLLGGVGLEHFR